MKRSRRHPIVLGTPLFYSGAQDKQDMEKYVCVHGHFYQPPRENPWLEKVELQDSAAPFHDWNERITSECYGRNTAARIFDEEGRIENIVNNYSKISFNFGPTLLTWMKDTMPWVHNAIVAADELSRKQFSGHGSAMAQNYNHMIMPLANQRDKETQVLWGIRDFESRFGRKPEGMWLAETAADSPTLEVLAEHGIKFTVLSPFQAREMRKIGAENWEDANGARIDPSRPYLMNLPSGKSITLFFYDAPVSQAVAFEKLLDSGEKFAGRLLSAFSEERDSDQLVNIGTDGESYGHHHRWGEMALAYALRFIESNNYARLTNYGEYLEKHSPEYEAQIHEGSAWSCSHGVGRWKENCGCNSGGHGDWNQNWRAPLRQALDWLRDELAPVYEELGKKLLKDPWAARNDYISVILNREESNVEQFLTAHARAPLSDDEKVKVLKMMELQRHAMLMYTSCGWFFDELSGLETVQVIQYAARAIQLAEELFNRNFEEGFLKLLENAQSNIRENGNGRTIYNKFVKPAMITWDNVVAHYAISSVFSAYEKRTQIFLYSFEEERRDVVIEGKARLVVGTEHVSFEITRETKTYTYAVLYMGEHQLTAAVRPVQSDQNYDKMSAEIRESFSRGDFAETIRRMDKHFGKTAFSLRSLFKDEQRRILNEIFLSTREDLENTNRAISERYTPLIHFLEDLGTPLPPALKSASDFIVHVDILKQVQQDETDFDRLSALLKEARQRKIEVFDAELSLALSRKLEKLIASIEERPGELSFVEQAARLAAVVEELPIDPNLWRVRNKYWKMLHGVLPQFRDKAAKGDENSAAWVGQYLTLGDKLHFSKKHLQTI